MKKNFDILKKQTRFYLFWILLIIVLCGFIFKGIYLIQYNKTLDNMKTDPKYSQYTNTKLMKKYFATLIILLLFLTGCSSGKEQNVIINNPYEISIKDKTLSYYDTESQINEDEFEISNDGLKAIQNTTNNIIVTDQYEKIRCISITNSKIITYCQIAVGDSIEKVTDTFNNEYKISNNNYCVLFNKNQEEDPMNEQKDDSWIWINYLTENNTIVRIQIYDVKFGANLK